VAVFLAFVVGTVLGMILLIKEMRAAGILHECWKPALLYAALGVPLMGLPFYFFSEFFHVSAGPGFWMWPSMFGAIAGALLGIVSIGTRVSKPFPFGPALAIGGLV